MLTPEYCEKQGMSCDICPINDCEHEMETQKETTFFCTSCSTNVVPYQMYDEHNNEIYRCPICGTII